MSDKELLQMAAKAAGHLSQGCDPDDFIVADPNDMQWKEWNPLDDKGLALDLAADLYFRVYVMRDAVSVACDRLVDVVSQPISDCRRAATSRAIVRAAAEIGRNM